jgi:O-methyltransferase domain/Dimerisation domain
MTAIELGVFAALAAGPADLETLRRSLGLHPRAAEDFLDALVALKLLERSGAVYSNAEPSDRFLDPAKGEYVGLTLEMANARLYGLSAAMTAVVTNGRHCDAAMHDARTVGQLVAEPERLRGFLDAMVRIGAGLAQAIAKTFPWSKHRTFVDVGSAQGVASAAVVESHPHLLGIGFDLAPMQSSFEAFVAARGLSRSLRFQAGDALRDALPRTDVVLIGHLLHELAIAQKKMLVRKAFGSLPSGGALIVFDAMIDDDRRENAFALLLSLNTMIQTTDGACYTASECQSWMREAGFSITYASLLVGTDTIVVGIK